MKKAGELFEKFAMEMYEKSFWDLDVFERLEVNLVVMTMEMKGQVR